MLSGGGSLDQKFMRDQARVKKEKSSSDSHHARQLAVKASMEEQSRPNQRYENQRQHQIIDTCCSTRKP